MAVHILVLVVIILVTCLYVYSKKKFLYWKDRNVYHLEPTFFYGNMKTVTKDHAHLTTVFQKLYSGAKALKKRYCGFYLFFQPHFVPVDIEVVKGILQNDFDHFYNRGRYINEKDDPLTGHLFNLEDEKWRKLRNKLTPIFTSETTDGFQKLLDRLANSKQPVNLKDSFACFTTDVIGSIAFGLDCSSMENPDSEFREYGDKAFRKNLRQRIGIILTSVFPFWLLRLTGFKTISKDIDDFFMNLVKDVIEEREKQNMERKDYLQLLIDLNKNGNMKALTLQEIVAQSFVFFIAGFETSATTMNFALLELSQNIDIQEELIEEIITVLGKHDNQITYEALKEMVLLDKVVQETLRKHPPLGFLVRMCNKDYKLPNDDFVLKKGTMVSIPVHAIQRDPDYYPDPEKFDPERFSKENIEKRPAFSYMPFGEGPRVCIGLRLGKLQAKIGLITLLKNYRVIFNEKTKLPITYSFGTISNVKGGVWVNLDHQFRPHT
ncbi:probable cytochrome P450 6a13 isoform X2 [Diabrotica virgifera virgifera]|uniref:Probable cytochrome P450 6a13 isoform X2 n=1 Tax=Diabrotica virgifera virgifera TaxID=50390 RepID=A0A6P7EZ71_DIAVI|nr:probable cytochrome P450 6a13 isoform X2 [Diabrotica virgifera virgifera]